MGVTKTLTTVLLLTTAALLLYRRRQAQRRKRRFAVRPLNRDRSITGNFYSLFLRMKEMDPEMFFVYTRMNVAMWTQLLGLVAPLLQRRPTRLTISVEGRLCITVRYLGEGCSMQEMAFNFKLGKSTIHTVIKEVTDVLWDVLAPIYLPFPPSDELRRISEGFSNRWNMPNCVGAIDGKHVEVRAPALSGSTYLNYKKKFSIVLIAACDAYYKFTFVDIGAAGSNHDSAVFSSSAFGENILNGSIEFPENRKLPNTQWFLPTFFVADQAFPLHLRIMRPYPGSFLGRRKNIFNYRLSRARRMIENTFGVCAQRWRVLLKPIVAELDMEERITKTVVVLHNFVQKSEEDIELADRRYCPTGYVDYEDENGHVVPEQWRAAGQQLRGVGRLGGNNASNAVKHMRDVLSDYFISDRGAVPWQEAAILRGALPN